MIETFGGSWLSNLWFLLLSAWLSDVYMKWQKLSQESCNQVYKPSAFGSHKPSSSSHDELLIPETELQRIHTLGSKHTHTHGNALILEANLNR